MDRNYFYIEENLNKIIEETLKPEVLVNICQIPTGWTNIVFEVETDLSEYIFRFPRNNFWSKMILKDYELCKFVEDKISFNIPDIQLHYDNNRPFSVHKKIKGDTLTSIMDDLTIDEISSIAIEINKFIIEINLLSENDLKNDANVPLSDFLYELADLHFNDKSLYNHKLFKMNNTGIVHGDLNPGNIIIENNKVVGILDFCFSGTGNEFADLSRIIGRTPKHFQEIFIKEYEHLSNSKVDIKLLEEYILAWKNIEIGYIGYIKNNNPDIDLSLVIQ